MLIFLSVIDGETDRSAFARLYDQYADGIFRKTLSILKNQTDAEDVVQEAWFKIAQNMDRLQGKEDRVACAYIMKIARNQALSFLRKKTKEKIESEESSEETPVYDDALFLLCEKADIADIRDCFEALSEPYRDVLSLYFFYHHSIPQIASLLDIKTATANSRFTRGRKKLIELLERKGFYG